MTSINVVVKHQGKKHDVEVDTESTGETFKYQVFSLTGVEPDRQKILVKGGQLKDDTDMSKLGLRPGQTLMMMGTPGGSGAELVRPKEQIRFVEDMTDAEIARQDGATPAGLENLGNTCYLNSTLQTLRAVPELQAALTNYDPSTAPSTAGSASLARVPPQLDLTRQLRDLYKHMSETQEGFAPFAFLNALRTAFPQFAEQSRTGHGYAQQDAEEAWSQIVAQLRQKLPSPAASADQHAAAAAASSASSPSSFVDKYMAGEFTSTVQCDEPAARDAGEEVKTASEPFLKLNCHIETTTNHLRDGIARGLEEKIEKRSTVLDRDALFTKRSEISRLPKYLTVHFVRFFWKRDVQKKAKIMRKVTFPQELDVLEFCGEDLRKALVPVRDKLREVRKDEEDMERARKRRKRNPQDVGDVAGASGDALDNSKPKKTADTTSGSNSKPDGDAEMEETYKKTADTTSGSNSKPDGDAEMEETYKTDAEIEAEKQASLLAAKKELLSLVDENQARDEGANQTGLYELRGVVTHQGASADSGHYTSYVKKSPTVDPKTGKAEEDGNWWWFNDDKVSEVTLDKVEALAGGGESHSALILLYRAVPLPSVDE